MPSIETDQRRVNPGLPSTKINHEECEEVKSVPLDVPVSCMLHEKYIHNLRN